MCGAILQWGDLTTPVIPEVYAVNMAVLSKLTTQRSAVLTSGAVAAFFLYKKYGGKRRTRYMSVSYIDFVEKSKFFQYCVNDNIA